MMRTRFDFLPANTNYTLEICAVTRRKECGKIAAKNCGMMKTPPRAEHLNRFQWYGEENNGHELFRLRMPRLSERNGNVCCFRVIVVKLKLGQSASSLPLQSELKISTYNKVHENKGQMGAYIAEILGSNYMGRDILVGDGKKYSKCEFGK